jgi:hypothetical protein
VRTILTFVLAPLVVLLLLMLMERLESALLTPSCPHRDRSGAHHPAYGGRQDDHD